ncbi:hypothetical protein CsSME_00045655 [Camellia sinensis var. sinensis]
MLDTDIAHYSAESAGIFKKLESLEALKKTFKKLDHDVNIQDFLGSRFMFILMNLLNLKGLTLKIMKKYNLREKVQGQHQTYALGIKEGQCRLEI